MRTLVVALVVLSLAGCTTLRTISGAPSQLRRDVAAGALLKAGDRVEVVTGDGKVHRLEVVRVADGQLVGREESVPIEQIAAIRKREIDVLPTAGVVGSVALVLFAAIVAAGSKHHGSCTSGSWLC